VLLHVTSLPSPYGIGDLGPTAVAWIDRLHDAGQSWWQLLPLGPTGYGDSPYQAVSSFAGNLLLISPAWLIDDELVGASDCCFATVDATAVDFEAVRQFKSRLVDAAWRNFRLGCRSDLRAAFERFGLEHAHWLDDYALFRALQTRYAGTSYLQWPEPLVRRVPAALEAARRDLASEIERVRFAQFLWFRQAERLHAHAREAGVRLLGDLPFFAAPESSDVWSHPELFLLDPQHRPQVVAGVPPDYFSAQGQLWGNPIYNWEALRTRQYLWWIDRVRAMLGYVDAIRLDHFRGFTAAWHIPSTASTAESGIWVPGPGSSLFSAADKALGALPFVAEDLGIVTAEVIALRDAFDLPGTRVLQFAFDENFDNPHLPNNYVHNTVVYTGTHDNPTTRGWYEDLPATARRYLWRVAGRPEGTIGTGRDAAAALLDLAWSSVAALAVAPLQDVLNLGTDARMNRPGTASGNWRWRAPADLLFAPAFESLRTLTQYSCRCAAERPVSARQGLSEQPAAADRSA
jgi:4-alpha-glucanotransferase